MLEIHLTGIEYIEINSSTDLQFNYKPEVPKLKVVGKIIVASDEEDDDVDAAVFLTQKQLNQILLNKEVELKTGEDNRWTPAKPLTKDQVKKIGLVTLESEHVGNQSDLEAYEVIKVS